MELDSLKPTPGTRRNIKRKGRGASSGHGSTSGRGDKGQRSRAGGRVKRGFEGGQMPLQRRLPKRGFKTARFAPEYAVINVARLEVFDPNTEITIELLKKRHIISGKFDKVKVLGVGEITKPVTVKVHAFSKIAKEKIEKAGGQAVVI
jgi:large subunit ribosomal protein L15